MTGGVRSVGTLLVSWLLSWAPTTTGTPPVPARAEQGLSEKALLERILEKATANEKWVLSYGYSQETLVSRLDRAAKATRQDKLLYRITWVEDRPYPALVMVDGRGLTASEKTKEEKRRNEFARLVRQRQSASSEEQLDIAWADLYRKYDFSFLPSQPGARYVISYKPKTSGLLERNRIEKLMNHVAGTIWVDEDLNIRRITARLLDTIGYGLGLLVRVEELEMDYSQMEFDGVWLPASFDAKARARVALIRTERREFKTRFFDFFSRAPTRADPKP